MLSVLQHHLCMVICAIYHFLLYFVCVERFINCTLPRFFHLYCNVFRVGCTFHCMSISSKKKLLHAYFETQIIVRVFWVDPWWHFAHIIHARIQDFFSGRGGGGPGSTARKQSGQRFFGVVDFCQFILQFTEGVQWFYYRENYAFQMIPTRGSNIFRMGGGVGSNFFQGVQMLISIETHITFDPIPPLDPHMS